MKFFLHDDYISAQKTSIKKYEAVYMEQSP